MDEVSPNIDKINADGFKKKYELQKEAYVELINLAYIKQKRIDNLLEALRELINATEYGVNQWQKAFHPQSETNGQKAIRKAKQALQRDASLREEEKELQDEE